jgi:hypothetical protein
MPVPPLVMVVQALYHTANWYCKHKELTKNNGAANILEHPTLAWNERKRKQNYFKMAAKLKEKSTSITTVPSIF